MFLVKIFRPIHWMSQPSLPSLRSGKLAVGIDLLWTRGESLRSDCINDWIIWYLLISEVRLMTWINDRLFHIIWYQKLNYVKNISITIYMIWRHRACYDFGHASAAWMQMLYHPWKCSRFSTCKETAVSLAVAHSSSDQRAEIGCPPRMLSRKIPVSPFSQPKNLWAIPCAIPKRLRSWTSEMSMWNRRPWSLSRCSTTCRRLLCCSSLTGSWSFAWNHAQSRCRNSIWNQFHSYNSFSLPKRGQDTINRSAATAAISEEFPTTGSRAVLQIWICRHGSLFCPDWCRAAELRCIPDRLRACPQQLPCVCSYCKHWNRSGFDRGHFGDTTGSICWWGLRVDPCFVCHWRWLRHWLGCNWFGCWPGHCFRPMHWWHLPSARGGRWPARCAAAVLGIHGVPDDLWLGDCPGAPLRQPAHQVSCWSSEWQTILKTLDVGESFFQKPMINDLLWIFTHALCELWNCWSAGSKRMTALLLSPFLGQGILWLSTARWAGQWQVLSMSFPLFWSFLDWKFDSLSIQTPL